MEVPKASLAEGRWLTAKSCEVSPEAWTRCDFAWEASLSSTIKGRQKLF